MAVVETWESLQAWQDSLVAEAIEILRDQAMVPIALVGKCIFMDPFVASSFGLSLGDEFKFAIDVQSVSERDAADFIPVLDKMLDPNSAERMRSEIEGFVFSGFDNPTRDEIDLVEANVKAKIARAHAGELMPAILAYAVQKMGTYAYVMMAPSAKIDMEKFTEMEGEGVSPLQIISAQESQDDVFMLPWLNPSIVSILVHGGNTRFASISYEWLSDGTLEVYNGGVEIEQSAGMPLDLMEVDVPELDLDLASIDPDGDVAIKYRLMSV